MPMTGKQPAPADICIDLPLDTVNDANEDFLTVVAENIQLCPKCNSVVRKFYINLNETVKMCENPMCTYPFEEGLEFFKEEEDDDDEMNDISSMAKTIETSSITASTIGGWSDVDRVKRVYDSEDTQSMKSASNSNDTDLRKKKSAEKEDKIKKHLNDIKKLHQILLQDEEHKPEDHILKSQKLLKNLKSLEEMSGVELLKPEEKGLLRKDVPIGLGELKIDINPGNCDSVTNIKISLFNDLDK